jgi:hypothetical protein
MKLKVVFAAVIGLLVAVLTLPTSEVESYSGVLAARLVAVATPSQQTRASAAPQMQAAAGQAATQQAQSPGSDAQARSAQGSSVLRLSPRWHRRPAHLPRPPRAGSPQASPSAHPSPSVSPAAGSPQPSASALPSPSGTPPAGSPQPSASARPSPSGAPPAQQQVNCALIVPAHPLSAQGLATPWELTRDGAGQCHEANPDDSAFVEAAILDRATGQIAVYDPLVLDRGSRPAVAPTRPTLPKEAVVAIWVGFNGDNLTLRGPGSDSCLSGIEDSDFGQNAFCNATAFFASAHQAMQAGKLVPPALGIARDGKPCPTARDFSVVDQDQSDNTTTSYLVTRGGLMAQDTPANIAKLQGAQVAHNGSDEGLLVRAIDKALGCMPWTVRDLADSTRQQRSTAWPLNELMASARQAEPIALVPAGDPFVFVGDDPSLPKLNAYRAGVDQPAVSSLPQASTKAYCRNLLGVGLPRIAADRQFTEASASPFPAEANNLFNFLALRFSDTFSNDDGFLRCQRRLHVQNPVKLHRTGDVVTGAKIDLHPGPAGDPQQPQDPTDG